jgi:hypothetical protein
MVMGLGFGEGGGVSMAGTGAAAGSGNGAAGAVGSVAGVSGATGAGSERALPASSGGGAEALQAAQTQTKVRTIINAALGAMKGTRVAFMASPTCAS